MTKNLNYFLLAPLTAALFAVLLLMPTSASAQNVNTMSREYLIELVNQLQAQLSGVSGIVESGTYSHTGTNAQARPTVRGTARNVNTVSFRLTTNSGDAYNSGAIPVDSNGSWSHRVEVDLRDGTYTVVLSGAGVALATGQIVVQSQNPNSTPMSVEQLVAIINELQAEINRRQQGETSTSVEVSSQPTQTDSSSGSSFDDYVQSLWNGTSNTTPTPNSNSGYQSGGSGYDNGSGFTGGSGYQPPAQNLDQYIQSLWGN